MTDSDKTIRDKINKHAFSGGQATVEEHRRLGGNVEVDVPYQYMSFFIEDDDELERIATEYTSGRMLTGEIKKMCIATMQKVVREFQDVSRLYFCIMPTSAYTVILIIRDELRSQTKL